MCRPNGEISASRSTPPATSYLVGSSRSEFRSSGEFVRNITGAEVPGGFGGKQGWPASRSIRPAATSSSSTFSQRIVNNVVDEFSPTGKYIEQLTGPSPSEPFGQLTGAIAVNSNGYLYVADASTQAVDIFKPKHPVPRIAYPPVSNPTPTSGTLNANVKPSRGEEVTTCHFEYGTNTSTETAFGLGELPCLDYAAKRSRHPNQTDHLRNRSPRSLSLASRPTPPTIIAPSPATPLLRGRD